MKNINIPQRVPEFRAYDKDKGIMIHDFQQSISKHYNMKWGESIHQKVYEIGLLYGTLSQFTGELDNKGNRVFEGDLLDDGCGNTYVVIFKHGGFITAYLSGQPWCTLNDVNCEYTVVGNIHQ